MTIRLTPDFLSALIDVRSQDNIFKGDKELYLSFHN